jgi:hypothetical protein
MFRHIFAFFCKKMPRPKLSRDSLGYCAQKAAQFGTKKAEGQSPSAF